MYRNYNSDSQLTKTMTEEQFDRVVGAIVSGKYSWACLLILRFAGYNPLHYIPHRTYNRLMKSYREHKFDRVEEISVNRKNCGIANPKDRSPRKLRDLPYIEEDNRQSTRVKGGARELCIDFLPNLMVGDLKHN